MQSPGYDPSYEAGLVRDVIAGSPSAADTLAAVLGAKIYHYALYFCDAHDHARDVAQESILVAFSNLSQLKAPEKVRAWAFRIARRVCTHHRRSISACSQGLDAHSIDEASAYRCLSALSLPEERLLHSELRDHLSAAIRTLPENQRTVLLLRDVEELSTGETAEVLEISEQLVRTRVIRARAAMRKRLDRYDCAKSGARRTFRS